MSGTLIERLQAEANAWDSASDMSVSAGVTARLMREAADALALSVEQEPVGDANLIEIAADLRRDLADTHMWSGSALIAGDKVSDADGHHAELYRWLCRIGNHLEYYASTVEGAASALSTAIRELNDAAVELQIAAAKAKGDAAAIASLQAEVDEARGSLDILSGMHAAEQELASQARADAIEAQARIADLEKMLEAKNG